MHMQQQRSSPLLVASQVVQSSDCVQHPPHGQCFESQGSCSPSAVHSPYSGSMFSIADVNMHFFFKFKDPGDIHGKV
uniref:Uncharacterized protein n=1 Tax=Setaria italica TaxID=4555 RepID=K3YXB9_SETIT